MKENIIIIFKIVKWVFKSVFVILGILPFSRCGSGYKEKDGKVFFNGKEITDKSFVILNNEFAKSDSAVYYKSYSISDADRETFVSLDAHYAKDKNVAYYCDEEREGQNYYLTKHSVIVKIKDVHSESFRLLGEGYEGFAKDNKRGYLKGVGFQVKDVATLSIIDGQFLKDKYQVYFQQKPVKNADVNSFKVLNEGYAKDMARVYYYGFHDEVNNGIHEIPCNPNTFKLLEYPYSKDETSVFYIITKINEADTKSFSVVGNGFSKDKNHVYFETKILQGADAESFIIIPHEESLDEFNFTKDKNHIFYQDKMMNVKDINEFKVIGLEYSTDVHHVYHRTNIVKNADPKTFKVYEHGYGDEDAEDAKSKFLAGKKVRE
jgi:DKNYY family